MCLTPRGGSHWPRRDCFAIQHPQARVESGKRSILRQTWNRAYAEPFVAHIVDYRKRNIDCSIQRLSQWIKKSVGHGTDADRNKPATKRQRAEDPDIGASRWWEKLRQISRRKIQSRRLDFNYLKQEAKKLVPVCTRLSHMMLGVTMMFKNIWQKVARNRFPDYMHTAYAWHGQRTE